MTTNTQASSDADTGKLHRHDTDTHIHTTNTLLFFHSQASQTHLDSQDFAPHILKCHTTTPFSFHFPFLFLRVN